MRGDFRIGHGFDAHRFKRGRKLVLGGIEIPHSAGLAGHSDADARYKNISSAKLLEKVLQTMRRAKFSIVNGDVTVIAEKPRLAPHYEKIRRRLAQLLQTPAARINLKAATTEGMGWIGAEEGIAATAVVLLEARRKA